MKFNKTSGLNYTNDPCDTKPVNETIRGFKVETTCQCNSCAKTCNFENDTTMSIMEGFSLWTVGIIYFMVAIFTFIIFMCKWFYKKRHPNESSRASSFDSEYNNLSHSDSGNQTSTLINSNNSNVINNQSIKV